LGQRHGFTLFAHKAGESDVKPHYVVAKDIEKNTITVSSEKFPTAARGVEVVLCDTNWFSEVASGAVEARYRYRQALISAELSRSNGETVVFLKEPHFVPLGQSLVLYRGRVCLGGGAIKDAKIVR